MRCDRRAGSLLYGTVYVWLASFFNRLWCAPLGEKKKAARSTSCDSHSHFDKRKRRSQQRRRLLRSSAGWTSDTSHALPTSSPTRCRFAVWRMCRLRPFSRGPSLYHRLAGRAQARSSCLAAAPARARPVLDLVSTPAAETLAAAATSAHQSAVERSAAPGTVPRALCSLHRLRACPSTRLPLPGIPRPGRQVARERLTHEPRT